MQPIHNPCADLRQSLQSDIEAYLKRGGKIKSEPVKVTPTKPSKFVMISGKKEFERTRQKAKKEGAQIIDVRYCQIKGVYHIYQGEIRLTDKGFLSGGVARMQADKLQKQLDRKSKR
jgi:hypothetical protein